MTFAKPSAGGERIIVPLDVPDESAAVRLAETLLGQVGAFKVGLELIHAAGFGILETLRKAGVERIFYDCKLHDIPNTVAGAVRALCQRNVWMFNVHAAGGARMIEAAAGALDDCCAGDEAKRPIMLGVTLLTSLSARELATELHVDAGVCDYVAMMAEMATTHGCKGIVCSPHEIMAVRRRCGSQALIVTPGIRPSWAQAADQRRIMTPARAIRLGADYLVIGRPITGDSDPAAAARRIAEELEHAQGELT
jgi:orotidine-5'-phosphate decarboxylase